MTAPDQDSASPTTSRFHVIVTAISPKRDRHFTESVTAISRRA
jgi:hypothetical protein